MSKTKKPYIILSRDKFDEAFLYASELHREQGRKGLGEVAPYMVHLMAVASLVAENAMGQDVLNNTETGELYTSEELIIAALLHDTIEDQGQKTSFLELENRFGKNVRDLVEWCTEIKEAHTTWEARKAQYIQKQTRAPLAAVLLSCCDKTHNLRAMLASYYREGISFWQVFTKDSHTTLAYYEALHQIYKSRFQNTSCAPLLKIFENALHDVQNVAP